MRVVEHWEDIYRTLGVVGVVEDWEDRTWEWWRIGRIEHWERWRIGRIEHWERWRIRWVECWEWGSSVG